MKDIENVKQRIRSQIAVANEIDSDFISLTVGDGKAILKTLEPEARVLTPEEVLNLPYGTVVWELCVDTRKGKVFDIRPAMVSDKATLLDTGGEWHFDADDYQINEDGFVYRIWSAKPTEDQRKATEWEEWK